MKKSFFIIFIFFCLLNLSVYGYSDDRMELDFAKKAIKDGFYDLAEGKLNAILYFDVSKVIEAEARLLLGKVYYSKLEYDKAVSEFKYILTGFDDPDLLASAQYWIAEISFDKAQYVRALSEYQDIIKKYPVSNYIPFAIYSQAWCYEKMGEYEMAIDTYHELIDKYPLKDIALKSQYKIAEIRYKNFDNAAAVSALNSFIDSYPVNERIFDAYYMLGDTYFRMGEDEKALVNFRKSLKGSTEKEWKALAEYKLAKIELKKGNNIDSDHWFAESFSDSKDPLLASSSVLNRALMRKKDMDLETGFFKDPEKEMVALYKTVCYEIDENPLTQDAFFLLGEHYYSKGKYNLAVKTYEDAFSVLSGIKNTDKLQYSYAWALLKNGRTEEARDSFLSVIEISENKDLQASSLFTLAGLYREEGQLNMATETYDKILKQYFESSFADRAQYELGVIFTETGKIDSAIMAFRALEVNFPDSYLLDKTLFQLGNLYMEKGDETLANIQFDRILEDINGSDLKYEALLQKAKINYQKENYEKTIDICRVIIRESVENRSEAEYYTAWSKYKLGKEDEAFSRFKDLLTKEGDEDLLPGIKLWFGQYYYQKGDFDSSMDYFNQVKNEFPGTSYSYDAVYWIGWVLFDSGAKKESLEQFRKLVTLFPSSNRAPQAMLAIGDIYLKSNDVSRAIKEFEALIHSYPNTKIANLAKEKIGTSFKLQGQYMRAIDYYKMALTDENSEINSQIQFDTAECYDKDGKVNEAIEEYLKVEYKYPKSDYWVGRALLRCAELLEKEGHRDRALNLYKKLSSRKGKEADLAKEKIKILEQYAR